MFPSLKTFQQDPLQYGYRLNEEDDLVIYTFYKMCILLSRLPISHHCVMLQMCKTIRCPCLVKHIVCSQFSKCEEKKSCKDTLDC